MHFYARFPTHRRFYAMSVSELRATNLSKLFHATIKGDKPITTKTFQQFLESIYTQTNKSVCIHKLISETHGLSSLQTSIWFKLSADFCNGDAAKLLRYLSSPDILTLADGTMLRDILKAVVSPAIFWDYLVKMFMEGRLDSEGQFGLAWLLCQVIYLLPPDDNAPFRDFASKVSVIEPMMASSDIEIRNLAHRIRHKVSGYDLGATSDDQAGPGGRHDNDFVNFREISIIPTADEVRSTDPAFIRPSNMFEDEATRENRHGMYLDNQFRLLREDMLYEIREELRVDAKRKNSRNPQLTGLTLVNVHYQPEDKTRRRRGIRWGIVLRCKDDLWQFQRAKLSKPEKRKDWLQDNRNFLKHQSIACLKLENELVALTTIERDEDLLVRNPPEIALHIEGAASIIRALVKLKTAASITLIQINTAIFAYHPILKAIQETKDVPLEHELLFWDYGKQQQPLDVMPSHIVDSLRQNPSQDLQSLLGLAKSVKLDDSQSASLLEGLTKTVSLIQGPPGTGKSFIGALLAKSLQSFAEQKILVVCYTNHALDQFLEDLMDIGIPESDMVRLGGKSSDRTKCLTLQQHPNLRGRLSRNDWTRINLLQEKIRQLDQSLRTAADHYYQASIKDSEIMVYLEFDQSNEEYFDAFSVPKASEKGMKTVGRGGKSISEFYLLNRWSIGRDAGTFVKHPVAKNAARVWSLPSSARQAKLAEWKEAILHEQATLLQKLVQEYDQAQRELDAIFDSKDRQILNSVQIIGCTTTAAAMFRDHITAASPNLLLVEEAGEILESHILTALSQTVKQLILIGDHKQLRPKVQSYELTIEKGEGYDLNRSLFERLVLKKYPHTTLTQQHRMRPEISALVRLLTYPDLKDAPSTIGRDDVRGLRMNVVFIQHSRPEEDNAEFDHILEKTETSHKLSKRNPHEVQMVLKILKYMGQQGYRTDQIIILTPYLGQLRALRQALSKDNDPVLNDLDTHDLVTAGLMDPKAAQVAKKSIRLATIDNYQGEESDIVIASLTRSNKERKIGFMSQEQRVNVLLSRARLGLIIIGDSETFLHAKAPTNVWENLIKYLKQNNNICSGLPVQCEKHPDKIADLETPDDFDTKCPGGGCTGPCGALLACKKHVCPSKCHQISDHSKMKCLYLFQDNCPQGHSRQWECHAGPPDPCPSCEEKSKLAEKMNRLAFLAQERRDKKERDHNQKMAAIDDQIKEKHDALRDKHLEAEQKRALAEKEQELSYLSGSHTKTTPSSHGNSSSRPSGVSLQAPTSSSSNQGSNNDVVQDTPPETSVSHQQGDVSGPRNSMEKKLSPAEVEWLRQKQVEGANNDAIDKIMSLGGLEKVKQGILDIKARVEVAQSQGTSIKEDRFSVAMLGNPGTGKTTVARHYSRFLVSIQVIEGTSFVETTGSRLANDGVPQLKKELEKMLNAGGGVFFIDEAYQLADARNPGGSQVLDFLLAEIENQRGKLVFIFAGYNREMEKFFEHNPGIPSRVPYTFQFDDYEDCVLMDILEKMIEKKFSGRMKVDETNGVRGLSGRIVIRRLGRGRGQPGFGNVRELENVFTQIHNRQTRRIASAKKRGEPVDQMLLKREDLIGPDPSIAMTDNPALDGLQKLIGLQSVKGSVVNFLKMVKTNYERELLEKKPHQVSLNRVFLGSPGTGKTTVAKLYGRILADLGLLSNGEVVIKNPADFVGAHLGESESKTKAILESTIGKVLVIDEAYMLYPGKGTTDPYKTAVVDTIVAEIQSVPGEDRCVLLVGYKEQMEEMFQNVNPGLSRRFAIDNAFHFEDYNDEELLAALELKLKSQDMTATDPAKQVAIEVLSRARNRPNFGNIGEVENLLSSAKSRFQKRNAGPDAPFEPEDFDPDYRRSEHAESNLEKLFEDVVGCDDVIEQIRKFQQIAHTCKSRNIDPRDLVPTTFVFKGPPGTGKTTTARKMGQIYYDMGFLASPEVLERSTSDLVGEYVGQTGPKVKALLEKALGRVLFIDEAYRLGEGQFAKEAIDELVSCLTLDRYKGKIIVILAGYENEINQLLSVNPGLSSRFTQEVIFKHMSPRASIELMRRELAKKKVVSRALDGSDEDGYNHVWELIEQLSQLSSWGNARDLKQLANEMITQSFQMSSSTTNSEEASSNITLSTEDTISCIFVMLSQRISREGHVPPPVVQSLPTASYTRNPPLRPPPPKTKTSKATQEAKLPLGSESTLSEDDVGRDIGVSDAIWRQLQADRMAQEQAKRRAEEAMKALEEESEKIEHDKHQRATELEKIENSVAKNQDNGERERIMRHREQARLRELAIIEEKAKIQRALDEEARVQVKIRRMGVCPAGFQWIKQESGYRCAGGVHFLTNEALGI